LRWEARSEQIIVCTTTSTRYIAASVNKIINAAFNYPVAMHLLFSYVSIILNLKCLKLLLFNFVVCIYGLQLMIVIVHHVHVSYCATIIMPHEKRLWFSSECLSGFQDLLNAQCVQLQLRISNCEVTKSWVVLQHDFTAPNDSNNPAI